jgi:branched-chain amino acid transport system substrate-binding protein
MNTIKPSRETSPSSRRRLLISAAGGAAALGFPVLRVAHAADDLRLGWVRPLTGPLASSFAPLYYAGDVAIDEINAAGGILGRKLVKVESDDEGSPAKETIVMRQLSEQGVKFIVGPTGSSQAVSALSVSTPLKIIQGCIANADELGDGKQFPFHYQFNFRNAYQAKQHAIYLQKAGIKKAGILVEDSAAGASSRAAMQANLAERGIQIVDTQIFPLRTPDMSPFLRKLRAEGAEAIDCHVSNNLDITQFLVGLSRMRWQPVIVGHYGLLFAGVAGAVPDDARYKDVYTTMFRGLTYTDTDKPPAKVLDFARKIMKGSFPESVFGQAITSPLYDYLYALKAAIEKAKSAEPQAVKDVFDGGFATEGLFGKMSFTPDNHTAYSPDLLTMAVVNSGDDAFGKEYKGLFRRRAPGMSSAPRSSLKTGR